LIEEAASTVVFNSKQPKNIKTPLKSGEGVQIVCSRVILVKEFFKNIRL
jgi:hypothetical protein